jgi:hypothetical protein
MMQRDHMMAGERESAGASVAARAMAEAPIDEGVRRLWRASPLARHLLTAYCLGCVQRGETARARQLLELAAEDLPAGDGRDRDGDRDGEPGTREGPDAGGADGPVLAHSLATLLVAMHAGSRPAIPMTRAAVDGYFLAVARASARRSRRVTAHEQLARLLAELARQRRCPASSIAEWFRAALGVEACQRDGGWQSVWASEAFAGARAGYEDVLRECDDGDLRLQFAHLVPSRTEAEAGPARGQTPGGRGPGGAPVGGGAQKRRREASPGAEEQASKRARA